MHQEVGGMALLEAAELMGEVLVWAIEERRWRYVVVQRAQMC